jgi:hypothetical protein
LFLVFGRYSNAARYRLDPQPVFQAMLVLDCITGLTTRHSYCADFKPHMETPCKNGLPNKADGFTL